MNFKNNEELMDFIILKHPDKYWNWKMKLLPFIDIKFIDYRELNRQIIYRKKMYFKIYNWMYKKAFLRKLPILWKIAEYHISKKYHPNGVFMKDYVKTFYNSKSNISESSKSL